MQIIVECSTHELNTNLVVITTWYLFYDNEDLEERCLLHAYRVRLLKVKQRYLTCLLRYMKKLPMNVSTAFSQAQHEHAGNRW